jgi:hypothetical protein
MVGMFLNIVTFLLTTYFYYNSMRPSLTYDTVSNPAKYESYMKKYYIGLAGYFFVILIVQYLINTYAITSNCGGVLTENITAAGLLTFFPWALIFGAVVLVLTIFPGFKGAFSDVVGYFYVANDANRIITDLLLNQKVEKAIGGNSDNTPTLQQPVQTQQPVQQTPTTASLSQTGGNKNERERLEDAADAIIKICGNTSVLINQLVPSNFVRYWQTLNPLMKPKYRDNSPEGLGIRDELFKITVTRDNFGEAMWFVYTGILIASITQMKIANRGCQSNVQAMEDNYQKYKQQEQAEIDAKSKIKETDYTITN